MSKPDIELKRIIEEDLRAFERGDVTGCSLALFQHLGYRTDKRLDEEDISPEGFLTDFDQEGLLSRDKALVSEWQTISLLFQVTKDEIVGSNQMRIDFGSSNRFEESVIESYLFLGITLQGSEYSRTQLSTITRELNKLFAMPVMVIFRYGLLNNPLMTLAVIDRRPNKNDDSKDVLKKVTLIRDISVLSPHRAHVEILFDLSLEQLYKNHKFSNFEQLHRAWKKTLDSSELNNRFFKDLANWYFWATEQVRFPKDAITDSDGKYSPSVIRMITRLIFVWFLKEKGLVPDELFRLDNVKQLLHFDAEDGKGDPSSYYKAILQNLFFATLNQEMNTAKNPKSRRFRGKGKLGSRDSHYGVANVYRYEDLFKQPERALELFDIVPFLNGGLFECLDDTLVKPAKRVDGFSDRTDNTLLVPNEIFFAKKRKEDLNTAYGTKNKKYEVQGLIDILLRYKFTIAENTPLEEEIALDPELLGKVFENLLASYNEETKSTARKKTGSFYTPREVVDYMVNESLKLYLLNKMTAEEADEADEAELEEQLGKLLDYKEAGHSFDEAQVQLLIEAIDHLKMIDPAVGSGAFPMGILQKLVFLLSKLDPKNERWRDVQFAAAQNIEDSEAREAALEGIQEAFERNELDYGRKLYLIEKCVYGVDIQPIAVQIAKLRFFISLIVDQRVNDADDNRGIRPLPNLETKFVAANTLLSIEDASDGTLKLKSPEIEQKEQELRRARRGHFSARSQKVKQKRRDEDAQLRKEIGDLLIGLGFLGETATKMSKWNPYDQNASADFFDPEWMFGMQDGFDVVIGNPPYVRHEGIKHLKADLKPLYRAYTGTADLYVYFYEQGLNLLRENGILTYISSNKYFRAKYGEPLRKLLAEESTLHQIIDFGDAPVFTAIAYPTIVIVEKAKPKDQRVAALNWEMGEPIEQFASIVEKESFLMPQTDLNAKGWQLASDDNLKLLKRLRSVGKPLVEYVNGRFYYGIKTGLNEAFVVDRSTRDRLIDEHSSSEKVLKPFLRGRDIKRWRVNYEDLYLIKIESSENTPHPWSDKQGVEAENTFAQTYPSIYARFSEPDLKNSLVKRHDKGRFFWELRSCAYWEEFSMPKVILGRFMDKPTFTFDRESLFHNDALYMVSRVDEYVVAILNSKICWWFLKQVCTDLQNGYIQAFRKDLSEIPIAEPESEVRKMIISIVELILYLSKQDAKLAQDRILLEYLEQITDALIYEIYFPQELREQDVAFFNHLRLEHIPSMKEVEIAGIEIIHRFFHSVYSTEHSVRINLFALDTVPSIRIIEGKA